MCRVSCKTVANKRRQRCRKTAGKNAGKCTKIAVQKFQMALYLVGDAATRLPRLLLFLLLLLLQGCYTLFSATQERERAAITRCQRLVSEFMWRTMSKISTPPPRLPSSLLAPKSYEFRVIKCHKKNNKKNNCDATCKAKECGRECVCCACLVCVCCVFVVSVCCLCKKLISRFRFRFLLCPTAAAVAAVAAMAVAASAVALAKCQRNVEKQNHKFLIK